MDKSARIVVRVLGSLVAGRARRCRPTAAQAQWQADFYRASIFIARKSARKAVSVSVSVSVLRNLAIFGRRFISVLPTPGRACWGTTAVIS